MAKRKVGYKVFDLSSIKGIRDAERYRARLYRKYDKVGGRMVGFNKMASWGEVE